MQQQLKPLLMLVAVVLILGGAGLALCFGYAAWQVLYHPEKVEVVSYVLNNIATQQESPAVTMHIDGRVGQYMLSPKIKAFGLAYLFIVGLGLLVSIARCLSDAGVHILKAIWAQPTPRKAQTAPARKPDAAV
ncbi:MAG TPA: hypothetical protein VEF76_12285 [Patescibacteria group bacterium]|nr:hypothetical protein [Patescibacteria group bacterium]